MSEEQGVGQGVWLGTAAGVWYRAVNSGFDQVWHWYRWDKGAWQPALTAVVPFVLRRELVDFLSRPPLMEVNLNYGGSNGERPAPG